MRSNLSRCVEPNSCVAGVCTSCRKATRRRDALVAIRTIIANATSPKAARCLRPLMSQSHRPNLQSPILKYQPPSPNLTPRRAVRCAKRRCVGTDLRKSKAGESSCTAAIARTGTAMTEAPHDNAGKHEFVGHFRSARISSCCAWHWNLSDSPCSDARRTLIGGLATTYNRCVCFGRHDHTGQNPGDNPLPRR